MVPGDCTDGYGPGVSDDEESPEVRLSRLRANGHPVRIRILELLRLELSNELSFRRIRAQIPPAARGSLVDHLRKLAEAGFITRVSPDHDPDPVYRGVLFGVTWEEEDLEHPERQAAVVELDRTLTDRRIRRIRDHQARKKRNPHGRAGWKEPELNADGTLILTEGEAKYMRDEIYRLMASLSERSRRRRASGEGLANQQTMFITMLAFPLEDDA